MPATLPRDAPPDPAAARGAVLAMALCVAVLIAPEFLPVSRLSPIAADLGVPEGRAGQAISTSGLFAVITSLRVARASPHLDRERVQSGFTLLLFLSGVVLTLAPGDPVLMVGRPLLGIAVGGF